MNQKLSTSTIARNYKIRPKDLFSYLISESYLCKKGKDYKLTDNGIKLGGGYEENKEYTIVVWKHDCLDEIITNKFTPHLKDSKYRYPDNFTEIKKEFGKDKGDDVFKSLNQGAAILNTEQQLNQYLFSHGAKHYAKLLKAFKELLEEIKEKEKEKEKIQIIDYGCGQGIASIVFLNELERVKFSIANIEKIILIEPGELAINRAYKFLKKSANVIKINKGIDSISTQDLSTSKDAIKFHLFSNILDMGGKHFDIKKLTDNIANSQIGDNYFICVSALNEEKLHEFLECITSTKINSPYSLELEKILGIEKDTSKVDFSKDTRLPTVKFISYNMEDIDNPSTRPDSKPWKNIHIIFKKKFVK